MQRHLSLTENDQLLGSRPEDCLHRDLTIEGGQASLVLRGQQEQVCARDLLVPVQELFVEA